jgi:protocatechuate 3,4-dioxygenase beta subunit
VGSVVDPSNLPVAGVVLELRQVDTGAVRKISTGADGNFVFSNLVPGEYTLTVEASGFRRLSGRV